MKPELPVAPFELTHDSQTTWILKKLKEKEGNIQLLDFGCGKLRLLNALDKAQELNRVGYCATDVVKPELPVGKAMRFTYVDNKDLIGLPARSFDVIVVMNVVHELQLVDFAKVFETTRRLLKDDGTLLLVDMALLPEGEFRSLPYYPWEITGLLLSSDDESYNSKSGIPVIAMLVPRNGIPVFPQLLDRLGKLVLQKRDVFCRLAAELHSCEDIKSMDALLCRLSLNKGRVHDLGYLLVMSGLANLRILEHLEVRGKTSYEEVSKAAESILRSFFDIWHKDYRKVTFNEVLEQFVPEHTYEAISLAVGSMTAGIPSFFFPLRSENLGSSEFQPSETLDMFEDYFDYEDISKMGLGMLQVECYEKITGDVSSLRPVQVNEWMRWL